MHKSVVDQHFSGGHHDRMELAALAYLADHLDDEMSWIPRAVLNGRQPSDADMQALIDLLADVTVLEEQLGA